MDRELKRLIVVTGHYGSGKTEFSINLATKLKQQGKQVTIVDLDIVNPYFRTNDVRRRLEGMGIKVIAPEFAGTNLDLPSLPSEIYSVFDNHDSTIVFDVGGDDKGATALGRFNSYFASEGYDMFVVANTKRPLTKAADEVVEMVREIELTSRLKATALVNNTNLMQLTTTADIEAGQEIIEAASRLINVPVEFISGTSELLNKLNAKQKSKAFEMEMFIKMP